MLTLYAVSLLLGNSLKGIPIKVKTVRSYLQVAAGVIMNTPSLQPDPRYAQGRRPVEALEAILVFARSLEDQPNRREPLTLAMLLHGGAPVSESSPAFLRKDAAIHDWLRLGLRTGFRASEWVQESSKDPRDHPPRKNRKGDPRAVCGMDFVFRDGRGRILSDRWSTVLRTAHQVSIKFRSQKNGANGACILFVLHLSSTTLCAVRAALRLRRRAQLLRHPPNLPLAVFALASGAPRYVGRAMVVSFLRDRAKREFGYTDKASLAKYSLHSVRVGACVLLHAGGLVSPDNLMSTLRWRSDAYRDYTRSTPEVAAQVNAAIAPEGAYYSDDDRSAAAAA